MPGDRRVLLRADKRARGVRTYEMMLFLGRVFWISESGNIQTALLELSVLHLREAYFLHD